MTSSRSGTRSRVPTTSKYRYRLLFLPQALDEFRVLDGAVRATLKKLLAKRLDQPHVPGGELHGDLAGCYKIKLRRQGVRLVYQVEDDKLIVIVLAVDKRGDNLLYKSALGRIVRSARGFSGAGKAPRRR